MQWKKRILKDLEWKPCQEAVQCSALSAAFPHRGPSDQVLVRSFYLGGWRAQLAEKRLSLDSQVLQTICPLCSVLYRNYSLIDAMLSNSLDHEAPRSLCRMSSWRTCVGQRRRLTFTVNQHLRARV